MTERQKSELLANVIALGVTAYIAHKQMNDTGFRYAPGTKFWWHVATKSEQFAHWAWTQYKNAAPYYS